MAKKKVEIDPLSDEAAADYNAANIENANKTIVLKDLELFPYQIHVDTSNFTVVKPMRILTGASAGEIKMTGIAWCSSLAGALRNIATLKARSVEEGERDTMGIEAYIKKANKVIDRFDDMSKRLKDLVG